ncbi:MAG: four helix bundle protein [Bacteroidota bacterium]
MKNFKELIIWQKGIKIVLSVYKLVKLLPSEEKYGLISQLTRSSVSIPSNIAEGSSRKSQKEYYRFIEIAQGSAFELETQLIIVNKVFPDLSKDVGNILSILEEEQKMLTSFSKKLIN